MSTFPFNNSASHWAGWGPEECEAPDCNVSRDDGRWPSEEDACEGVIHSGPIKVRVVDRNDTREGDELRRMAKALAESFGVRWDSLKLEFRFYWMHRAAKVVADQMKPARRGSCQAN